MPAPRILPAAEADIDEALRRTLHDFGQRKYLEYVALIEEGLEALAENPRAGLKRPQINADAWIYPIARRGRRAAHLLLYRITEDGRAEIRGFPYVAMNLPAYWRKRGADKP